ncbi:Uncharacterized protein PODLI_1B037584 [Podarcis lilfordi]|uniref:Uncharacterized protein n=1 Tax=Podarcis lilfordi TaxID=74358 RepID=A0AA35P4I0_9SAUR|nr:Uncharacterized protein PODLI_1B037584 [Podarcis lilfordi]
MWLMNWKALENFPLLITGGEAEKGREKRKLKRLKRSVAVWQLAWIPFLGELKTSLKPNSVPEKLNSPRATCNKNSR